MDDTCNGGVGMNGGTSSRGRGRAILGTGNSSRQQQQLPPQQVPPQQVPPRQLPVQQFPLQQLPPHQLPPQQLPPQQLPPQQLPPQQFPPQQLPPQQFPPQQLPPQQLPPLQLPPHQLPLHQLPPQQLPPQHLPPHQLLPPQSVPEKNTSSKLSATATSFVPRSQSPVEGTSSKSPVEQLRELITTLKSNPAYYDQGLENIAQSFGSSVKDEKMLEDVVSELVKECIESANFRYTGARICQAFSTDLSVGFAHGNFRQYLLKRVHEEYKTRDELVKTPPGKNKLCGLTLFVGELLLHMRVANKRIQILSNAILDLVSTCLNNPEEMTIKNVLHVMKLTGCIIHHMEKEGNRDKKTPSLDGLFLRLKNLLVEDTYPRHLREGLLKLVEERVTWDAQTDVMQDESAESTQAPVQSSQVPDTSEPFTNEPTFYSATGQVITAEEAGFAPGEYDDGYFSGYNPGYPEYSQDIYNDNGAGAFGDFVDPNTYDDDELTEEDIERLILNEGAADCSNEWDDDIESAYEDFLNNQKNDAHNLGRWT